MKHRTKDYILITLGVIVAVAGLNLFLVPGKIAAGGVSGIATIFYHIFGIPLGLSIIVLNVPLFAFGLKLLGKSFAIRTSYALLLYSLVAEIMPIPVSNNDLFLGCVYGGALVGIGIGLVIRSGGSTGGTDMAAKILSAKFKSIGISAFVFGIDFVVIVAAGLIFEPTVALYAIASLFIATKIIDFFTVGLSAAKAFYIISDKSDEIAKNIMQNMGRGVTAFTAKGLYSGKDKSVLLCVLNWRTEGTKLKRLVKSIDAHAFVIVADVKEVLGEGF
ncbi:MAG: YitT family protein [Eubacteriales bacterium]|nr:YitT family protein [Eubacteriales bacterium]